jgi:hypothetical protein
MAIDRNDFSTAIRITLEYYDRTYSYGLSKRKSGQVVYVDTDTDDTVINAGKVLDAASAFK